MPTPTLRIPPAEGGADLDPPCGGTWLRQPDGALVPADSVTEANAARVLGLADSAAPAPEPIPQDPPTPQEE